MKRLLVALVASLTLTGGAIFADVSDGRKLEVQRSIIGLHTQQGPGKEYIIWGECGKRLRGKRALERAEEYADAIVDSVDIVERETGETIDLDYMVAILYRESSHDECVIGRQETNRLTRELGRSPTKKEIVDHVKTWTSVYFGAKRQCKEKGRGPDAKCIGNIVGKDHPHYRGIHGWDLGAAQYRWPGYNFRRCSFTLPSGRVVDKVGLSEIFDYRVSIHMLAQDMAVYRKTCRGHEHWLKSKWGKRIRKLEPEEAYFAHHHSGSRAWSERYWKAVNKHLKVIRENRGEGLVAKTTTGTSEVVY